MAKKKPFSERVFNQHHSGDTDTITARTKVIRPTCATDLSDRQIWGMLEISVKNGFDAISRDRVYLSHGFEPTDEDMEHIEWVCALNAENWAPWLKFARDREIQKPTPFQLSRPELFTKGNDVTSNDNDSARPGQRAAADSSGDKAGIRPWQSGHQRRSISPEFAALHEQSAGNAE